MKGPIGRVTAAATSLVVLTACAGDRPLAPEAAVPSFTISAANLTLPACNYSTANSEARALFSKNNDPVFNLKKLMSDATKANDPALATSRGFDVLGRVEEARGTADLIANTPATKFTKAILACTSHRNSVPSNFDAVMDKASLVGVYAARGGSLPTGAATSSSSPIFGAEAPGGWGTPRRLIYGALTAATNFFGAEVPLDQGDFTGFTLDAIPSVLFNPAILVGICGVPAAEDRLLHGFVVDGGPSIGAYAEPGFCSTASTWREQSSVFAFARRALSLLAPQEVHAFQISRGGVGSLETSLSPFARVNAQISQGISFVVQPTDGNLAGTVPVTVKVVTVNGTPIAGVLVVLSAINNNGAKETVSGGEGATGPDGLVHFNVGFPKVGGYQLLAQGFFIGTNGVIDPHATIQIISNRFNIRP